MPDVKPEGGFLFVLEKIDKLGEKWDKHIVRQAILTTKLGENLEQLGEKVTELTKLLTVDNGKPSIVSQVNSISTSLDTLKRDIISIQKHIGVKKQTSLEKWKTLGKVAGFISLVIPGILSFFGLAQ